MHHGSPSGAEYDQRPRDESLRRVDLDDQRRRDATSWRSHPRRWGSPASKLAEILRSGHPDKDGKPQVNVPDEDRRRVYLWMDLNIPYYGTSSSNHKAAARQPADDAAGPGRDAQRSRRAPLRRVPPGGRPAEVLHPRDEAREEQLPARPAGQGRRRHGEVRPAGLRLDRRSGLPEDPPDVRADPRPAPASARGPTCRSSRPFARSRSANHEYRSPESVRPQGKLHEDDALDHRLRVPGRFAHRCGGRGASRET